ncbi:MAG: MBL fold metallo-hydrolase [Prevotellaceae bacterium]|nr:MBL fold metallo-hydrolase [Candidatus Minthosoma caballi]
MKLTYIFHSGFVLESERCVLIFDYWMDPAHVLDGYMGTRKHVYVFSSHFHEDHFTKDIFKWRDCMPNITYILSKDILKRRRANRDDADVWMAKGAIWEDENLKVIATGSNDSGVSWIVEVEGKTIFHAGDLCNWYARFLADDAPEGEIYSEEFQEYINPVAEEKRFLGELKDIHKITGTFDLVMFPVDGRIGNGYTLGGRQFIDRFDVGMFVPMHFVASGFESAWRMEPFCQEKGIPFWCINEEGESLEIK